MTSAPAPRARRSPADRVASIVMSVLAVAAGLVSAFFSPFFVMATDSCGHDDCRDSLIGWAYAVTWGGLGLAAIVGVAGIVVAARRKTAMWVWPALALVLVVATFVIGAQLASSAAPGD